MGRCVWPLLPLKPVLHWWPVTAEERNKKSVKCHIICNIKDQICWWFFSGGKKCQTVCNVAHDWKFPFKQISWLLWFGDFSIDFICFWKLFLTYPGEKTLLCLRKPKFFWLPRCLRLVGIFCGFPSYFSPGGVGLPKYIGIHLSMIWVGPENEPSPL